MTEQPTRHGFADATETVWCLCGQGFTDCDRMDRLDEHIAEHEQDRS